MPVLLPLVVAAILINLLFAWLFPALDTSRPSPAAKFTDVTAAAGITFTHRHGSGHSPLRSAEG
ncbi:MAG: hypothetical protein J6386_11025 [Candidatus Synoicihabitans palmerolidicus]|nr:hypothetical protein [Candidatus Synoicihabitans palmerolidicus]